MKLLYIILFSVLLVGCGSPKEEVISEPIVIVDEIVDSIIVMDTLEMPELNKEMAPIKVLVSLKDTHTMNIDFPMFTVLLPKLFYEEVAIDSVVSRENDSLLSIELFQMFNADLVNSPFSIVLNNKDLTELRVEQQYSSTLFFNEDGSGGVWTIEDVEKIQSSWVELTDKGDFNYQTFSNDTSLFEFPEMNKESIIAAEVYKTSREWPTEYWEEVYENSLRFSWIEGGKKEQFIVCFHLILGD